MFKKILIGLVVVIGGFVAYAATRPDTYHVERSATVNAAPEIIFAQLDDFKAWANWSPWEKLDPGMKKTFSGPAKGPGSIYAWEGNDKVGKGSMEIASAEPPSRISYKLTFIAPFEATAKTDFILAPEGESTKVTWSMDGNNNLMGKIFGIFMDMDKAIGADYEKGLSSLKSISEAEAKKFTEAAAAKAAEAAAVAKAAAEAAAKAAEEAATAAAEALKGKGFKKAK